LTPEDTRISPDLVRKLIADQCPHWADLPVVSSPESGWDNRTFRLGAELVVRLPSAARYAPQVAKEAEWLPRLAPALPLPIPEVLFAGQPGHGYPYGWSVRRWIDGESASLFGGAAPDRVARDLGRFLNALHRVTPAGGPPPGQHNFHRGGDVRIYDQDLRKSLAQLGQTVDATAILRLWTTACVSPFAGPPVWLHGDMAPGNLLVDGNRLTGVIDFGGCAMGDPACDLTVAWTLFEAAERAVFAAIMDRSSGQWQRARGWAVWKALLEICAYRPGARRILERILADPVV
jgi:aminoglycoside phosphotransferase (APT) family kinase protein